LALLIEAAGVTGSGDRKRDRKRCARDVCAFDLHFSTIFSENGDHADEHLAAATAALDQPGGGRAGYDRANSDLQISRQ